MIDSDYVEVNCIIDNKIQYALDEMREELKKRDDEIINLKSVIGKLAAWNVRELGTHSVNAILDELNSEVKP
jgi:hypothetical protein